MPRDDPDADSTVDADDLTDAPTEPERPTEPDDGPVGTPPHELAARLSSTVPSRRAYGMERVTVETDGGLLSPRERQYLRHAHRLDGDDRHAVESVVSDRVGAFVETDWPMIRENCPEVAEAMMAELCEESG